MTGLGWQAVHCASCTEAVEYGHGWMLHMRRGVRFPLLPRPALEEMSCDKAYEVLQPLHVVQFLCSGVTRDSGA